MDLWQLEIYCKVIDHKSFSKAGEAIHLSQPTVSSHIKDLEEHFSTRLIDRTARRMLPTKAGELLYDYAHRLLTMRDETEAVMAEFTGKMKGHIAVGASTIPAGYLLPRIIGLFSNTFPDIRISLVVGDTSEILAKTASGRIEVSIVGADTKDKSLHQTALITDQMVLVVPKQHKWASRKRINLRELAREPFIVREAGSGTLRSLEQALRKHDLCVGDLNIVSEMGSTEAVRQAIKSNVGISILSQIAVSEEHRTGQLHSLKVQGLDLKRNFYLSTHRHRSSSPLCRAFIDFLKKNVKDITSS